MTNASDIAKALYSADLLGRVKSEGCCVGLVYADAILEILDAAMAGNESVELDVNLTLIKDKARLAEILRVDGFKVFITSDNHLAVSWS